MEKIEIELYDVSNRIDKRNMMKWIRTINADEVITIKILLRNPLMSEVVVSDLYLNCDFAPLQKDDLMDQMFGNDV